MASVSTSGSAQNNQALAGIGTFMTGLVMKAAGILQTGEDLKVSAEATARQLDVSAGQVRAAGQRASAEERRQGRFRGSSAKADIGKSGALGVGAENIEADIAAETDFRARTAGFNAESKAQFLEAQAAANRFGGQRARRASRIVAVGTIFSGAGSLFGKYGNLYKSRGDARFSEINASFNPRITG